MEAVGLAADANLPRILRSLGVRGATDELPNTAVRLPSWNSDDKCSFDIVAIVRAVVLNFVMPVAAEVIETKAVGFGVNDG